MRFYGLALAASAIVLSACGGDKGNASDTGSTSAMAGATDTTTAATGGTATAGSATMAPITGKTVEVKMVGDEKGYRFEPADITVKQGDGIKFVMVSGAPHNVAFDPATLPANVAAQLTANMPDQIAPLSSPMFLNPDESYTISFAGVAPGTYDFHCTPHLAMGMTGKITVQ